nr:hypothetical protein [Gluconacetobacter tumulisoli]
MTLPPPIPRRRAGRSGALALGVALSILSSAGISTARAAASAADDPIGIWTGTLVADRGICPETRAPSTLQIGTRRIAFTPADGSQTLRGTRDGPQGIFHAQLVLSDMNHKPFPMVFEARPSGDTMSGTYGTPRCRAHVVMTRPGSNALSHFLGH